MDSLGGFSTKTSSTENVAPETCNYFYPFVSKAIQDVASAASSSVAGSTYTEQVQWRERIEYLTAAYVLQQSLVVDEEGSHRVVDARLVDFALQKLVTCLNLREDSGSSGPIPPLISSAIEPESAKNKKRKKSPSGENPFKLDVPLPVPTLESKEMPAASSRKRKGKSSAKSAAAKSKSELCTFAGVFTDPPNQHDSASQGSHSGSIVDQFSVDEKLSLFIRAMAEENGVHGEELHESIIALVSHLIALVERCYDTRIEVNEESPSGGSSGPSSPASRKRKAEKTSARRGKRRKQASGKKTESGNELSVVDGSSLLHRCVDVDRKCFDSLNHFDRRCSLTLFSSFFAYQAHQRCPGCPCGSRT
jgi:hypothetical protein